MVPIGIVSDDIASSAKTFDDYFSVGIAEFGVEDFFHSDRIESNAPVEEFNAPSFITNSGNEFTTAIGLNFRVEVFGMTFDEIQEVRQGAIDIFRQSFGRSVCKNIVDVFKNVKRNI